MQAQAEVIFAEYAGRARRAAAGAFPLAAKRGQQWQRQSRSRTSRQPGPPTTRRLRQFEGRDRWIVLAMVGIPAILHIGLVWIPTIASILLSFTDWNGIRFSDMTWVGFKNYSRSSRSSPELLPGADQQLRAPDLPLHRADGARHRLAYMLDRDIRGTRFFQGIFFTPVVLSLAVVGFMWQSVIYSTENGLATQLFGGGNPVDWLGNQSFVIPFGDDYGVSELLAILVAIAWRHTGYIMVLYLAGLKSVDSSLREAAMLDGSNEWQVFRHVVFPSLKPINVVIAVITVIEALRAFDIIFVLNTPRKTEVLSILTTNNLLGEGAATSAAGRPTRRSCSSSVSAS